MFFYVCCRINIFFEDFLKDFFSYASVDLIILDHLDQFRKLFWLK